MVSDFCKFHEGSPFEQLTSMGMVVIRYSREYPGYMAAIRLFKSGMFSLEHESDQSEEFAEIQRYAQELTDNMENVVREGIKCGTIMSDIEQVELAIIIRMLFSSVMDIIPEIKWMLQHNDISEERIIQLFCTLMGSMIKGNKGCNNKADTRISR